MNEAPQGSEVWTFGPFLLDVADRRLLRDGEPVRLRAKLFDTLVELVRHAGRLVTREALLATVWPDAIVEEGNLSHNVSALRKAMRDGEGAKYIETVPRRGYRFVHPLDGPPTGSPQGESTLERARRFLEEGAWGPAHAAFLEARSAAPLGGDDRMGLAEAACWDGRYEELVPLLEDAAEAYRREENPLGAVRVALRLATVMLDRRRLALATSHCRQAERILSGDPEAGQRERGELERIRGRLRWAEADWEGALGHACRAAEIAHAEADRDTEALARMEAGHSLLALSRFDEAVEALEEAGAILTGGRVGAYASGITFCGLILAWRACGRWDNAAEWVDTSIRWADGAGVSYFPGMCRVHRGELICLRGELARAEEDLERGTRELMAADSSNAGPALRELGTVRLRRGDLAGAEEAFGRALEFGTDPQPGLARLRAARGETEAARRELERFLSEEGGAERNLLDREYRFEGLEAYVHLALATGEVEAARRAVGELESTALATGSTYHRAAADGAAAQLALAEGRVEEALHVARDSWRRWTELPAPYQAGQARERIGLALVADGDVARARMEFEGAASTFEQLGAAVDLQRLRHRLSELEAPAASALQLVACGQVVAADELRSILGDEAWEDLTAWLDRLLARCWSNHGGSPMQADEGRYAVAFRELGSCLACVAFVQRSLREHRALHGFAPSLRLAVADASALEGETDLDVLHARACDLASSSAAAEVVVLADQALAARCSGLARLREDGVDVRIVAP